MSGGAHHNPHGRQGQPNSAWNHLQVPNFFPRQPQLAHMSSDRPLSLSPLTWHTPTTSEPPTKVTPGPLYNLQQMMLAETRTVQPNPLDNIALATRDRLEGLGLSLNRQTSLEAIQNFTRHVALPGAGIGSVDLTLARSASSPHSLSCSPSLIRNGQNGETSGPISLSVRDTKQINSMDTAELNKLQTGRPLEMTGTSPSISQRSNSPKSPKPFKRNAKKMDTVLERLNSAPAELCPILKQSSTIPISDDNSAQQLNLEQRIPSPSVSLTPILTSSDLHTSTVLVTDDSTESIDKLRHKRKPDKTTRIEKESKECELSADVTPDPRRTTDLTRLKELDHSKAEQSQLQIFPQASDHVMGSAVALLSKHSAQATTNERSVIELNSTVPPEQDATESTAEITNKVKNCTGQKSEPEHTKEFISKPELSLENTSTVVQTSGSETNVQKSLLLYESSTALLPQLQSENKSELVSVSEELNNTNEVSALPPSAPLPVTKRRSSNEESHAPPCKIRRKTCSESETIDNIAAMIASGDDASVIVPMLPKDVSNENTTVKDFQSLAHVLAGPTNDEDLALLSTNNIQNNKDSSGIETAPNKVYLPTDDNDSSMLQSSMQVSQDTNQTTNFVQVENELEKMFAGIDETNLVGVEKSIESTPNLGDNVTSTSSENKPKRKLSSTSARANRKSSDSAENTPKKNSSETPLMNKKPSLPGKSKNAKNKSIKNQNAQKNLKLKTKQESAVKDILTYDSGSNASSNKSRGPFVQIKGPRDSPISVSIVNTSTNDEDTESRMKHSKTKKHHDDAEFRHKMRKGLHSSTLSMKYDATTTDVTWVCVFCKSGPHCGGTNLGDLFGPYLVTTACPEFQYSQQSPEDDPFKSKRTKQDMIVRNMLNVCKQPVKRKRSSHSETLNSVTDFDIYAGMLEASPGAYEVWGHEDCIIWAPGVYLVGSRVIGLEGAVWSSCRAKCNLCNLTGANVGCSQRGCDKFAHISCAARNDWHILEDVYKVTCPNHNSI